MENKDGQTAEQSVSKYEEVLVVRLPSCARCATLSLMGDVAGAVLNEDGARFEWYLPQERQRDFRLNAGYSSQRCQDWILSLTEDNEEELLTMVATAWQVNWRQGGELADSIGLPIMLRFGITIEQVKQAFRWLYAGVMWQSDSEGEGEEEEGMHVRHQFH
jgi:hypothetical protein